MRYAEVAVNSPAANAWGGRSFSYSIPEGLSVEPGQAVRVPFGSRILEGIVVELTDHPAFEQTRDIAGVIDDRAVISPAHLSLAKWISDYYLSPLFDAIALMLPPGHERKSLAFLSLNDSVVGTGPTTAEQRQVIELLTSAKRVEQRVIERALGVRRAQAAISQLVNRGIVRREYELQGARARPRTEEIFSLAMPYDDPQTIRLLGRSRKQSALAEALSHFAAPVSWKEMNKSGEFDRSTLKALIDKGIIARTTAGVTRDPLAGVEVTASRPLKLNSDQQSALAAITADLRAPTVKKRVFLLHGVTGSGKTEVYLQALAEAIELGKRGIVLVPEISLTPQMIERFLSRFPGKVAILHSHLSLGEQFDEWHRIRNGEFDVVVGPRSALFAPQPDLGIIVIDEEHEWTYKQHEQAPRYHAREAAIKLAGLVGATVVLGSATPDLCTYSRAVRAEFKLLTLPERVTPVQSAPLPHVQIVDLKKELKAGGGNLFSASLFEAVAGALSRNEQVILFLNRRGASTFIQCRKCGYVLRCKRCELSLTYHSVNDTLVCHQCNHRTRMPSFCPQCKSTQIKFLGAGTQKLEEEAKRLFAPARVLRWDSDATKEDSNESLMRRFASHEADILIGTQMITKGLDIPNVTVVGVINADVALNFPHYLSAERSFQLLSQVAGRAGRGPRGGEVFFQTYSPDHFAIKAASEHDYQSFYRKEIAHRSQLDYPPFTRLASLTYYHTSDTACQKEAERLKKELETEIASKGLTGVSLIGPAPAFVHRLRGRYRWQLIVRSADPTAFLRGIKLGRGWVVDIDPVGMS